MYFVWISYIHFHVITSTGIVIMNSQNDQLPVGLIAQLKLRNLYFNRVTPSVFVQDERLLSIEAQLVEHCTSIAEVMATAYVA